MFQKKEVIPEPIPLTSDDIQNIKDKLDEEKELKIKDISICDLLPQCFENVNIFIVDGEHVLTFSDNFNGDKYKTFKKSKGGIFAKDSLAYHKGKKHGKYLLIEGNGERKIVRLIEDEEMLLFQTLKLINGKIKDKPYMLFKKLQEGEKLAGSEGYIKKNSDVEDIVVEEVINITPIKIDIEDDHESINSSISLFDE